MFYINNINCLILHYANKKIYLCSLKIESKNFLALITKLESMARLFWNQLF